MSTGQLTIWQIILLASIAVLLLKLLGYLLPPSLTEKPVPARIAGLLTVALLSALIVTQTVGLGHSVTIDARLPALVVAAGLFALRVPFIVVIIISAATAALIRSLT